MKAGEIYRKTMKFVWMRLGLGALVTVISLVLLAIAVGISIALKSDLGVMLSLFIWCILTAVVYEVVINYMGYIVKAAHIAVVTQAVTTGTIPDNMYAVGKEMVQKRFGATNAYFVIDKLITGAVKQLQSGVGKLDNALGNIPVISTILSFVQLFIGIALGYIDECCLGYTFTKPEDGAFKAGCDGVVVYFQNIKHLLKSALGTTLTVMVVSCLAWVISFLATSGVLGLLGVPWFVSVLISVMLTIIVKGSFVDSYMMVKTMVSYMEVAPSTQITFDIYGKLCKLSSKFKSLFTKAQEESPSL